MRPFYFREAWRSFMHHRGLSTTAILALTAAVDKGWRSAARNKGTDRERLTISAKCGNEWWLAVPVKADRCPQSFPGLRQIHVISAVHGIERRHIQLLVRLGAATFVGGQQWSGAS